MESSTKGGKSVQVSRSKAKPKRRLTDAKSKQVEKMFDVFRIRQTYQYFVRVRFHHMPRVWCYPKDEYDDFHPIYENEVLVGGICGVDGCDAKVSYKGYYYQHIRDHHPEILGNHFYCGICGERFKLIVDAIDHTSICDTKLKGIPSDAIFVICREVKPRSADSLVRHGWYRQDTQSRKKRIISNDFDLLNLYQGTEVGTGEIMKNLVSLTMFKYTFPPFVYLSVFDEGYFPIPQKRKVSDYVMISDKRRKLSHKLAKRRCVDGACFEEEVVDGDNSVDVVNIPQNTDSMDDHSEDIEEVIEHVGDAQTSQNVDSFDDCLETIEEVTECVGVINTSQNMHSSDDHIEILEEVVENVDIDNIPENIDSTVDLIEIIEEFMDHVGDDNTSEILESTDDDIETMEVLEHVENVNTSEIFESTDDDIEIIEEFIGHVENVNTSEIFETADDDIETIEESMGHVENVNTSEILESDDDIETIEKLLILLWM